MYCMIVLYIHQVHLGLYCHISNKRRALTISHLECQLVYIHAPVMAAPVLSQTLCYKRKFNTVYEGDSWEQITLHKAQLQGLFFYHLLWSDQQRAYKVSQENWTLYLIDAKQQELMHPASQHSGIMRSVTLQKLKCFWIWIASP